MLCSHTKHSSSQLTRHHSTRYYLVVVHFASPYPPVQRCFSRLALQWADPRIARFLNRLASFSRLILFDKRGTGLSDPVAAPAPLEDRMDDVRAVMDAAGSERAALLGLSEGGAMSALFAATYPERTHALIL